MSFAGGAPDFLRNRIFAMTYKIDLTPRSVRPFPSRLAQAGFNLRCARRNAKGPRTGKLGALRRSITWGIGGRRAV
jgi:hypothetical protein